jgi:uridylate kinase
MLGKLGPAVLCLFLLGCGSPLGGVYIAEAKQTSQPEHRDEAYSLDAIQSKLDTSPREIVLMGGGKFTTREQGRTIWEGTWRTEGDKLLLNASRVNGVEVGKALREEKELLLKDGLIVDQGTYSAYGIDLIYRRK